MFPGPAVHILFTRIRAILNLKLTSTRKYQAYSQGPLHYSEYMVFNLHIQHIMDQLVNKKYTAKMRGFLTRYIMIYSEEVITKLCDPWQNKTDIKEQMQQCCAKSM